MRKHNAIVFLYFLLLLFPYLLSAQIKDNGTRVLKWKSPQSIKVSETETMHLFHVEGASNDAEKKLLPTYFEKFKLSPGVQEFNIQLGSEHYEPLSEAEMQLIKDKKELIETELTVKKKIGYEQKQPYGIVSFIPIRKNKSSGNYEKLVSFTLNFVPGTGYTSQILTTGGRNKVYAANSVLQKGSWYKLAVTTDGIYKLSFKALKDMGIDVAALNPVNLKLFGNGGGVLPQASYKFRHDDLVENAILVHGESDGKLDSTDYILFYGQGPNRWTFNNATQEFSHQVHPYSDTTYYFLATDLAGSGKRITNQPSSSLPVTNVVTSFDDYSYHEKDAINLIESGREWYGEYFDIVSSYNFSFNFPNIETGSPVRIKTDIAARGSSTSRFEVAAQAGTTSGTASIEVPNVDLGCYHCEYAMPKSGSFTFLPASSTVDITISKTTASTLGWLNYIEVSARRQLSMFGDQMIFRDIQSIGAGKISEFKFFSSVPVQIWEVTDPTHVKRQELTLDYSFLLATDSLREFIAFSENNFYIPKFFGPVANQNLHALSNSDLIIVSHPDFMNEATTLANLHSSKDSLSVVLVTPQQIYNEFSSGSQDVSAIRDFVKMFYDRATNSAELPRYLLLFGDGSYDNKRRSSNNSNYIVTYQSPNSTVPTLSYVSDEYYGLLDSNEGNWNENELVDIGIGRLPVRNASEAKNVLNKILKYTSAAPVVNASGPACNSNLGNSNYGDWRNMICFIADDEDGGIHASQADDLATFIDTTYMNYNIDKIYLDAYNQISTPTGHGYPDVNDAFNKRVEKGALIINYTGHGGEVGLAHERILDNTQINGWKNINTLPLFVTATCEFSRFDDPDRTSAGENVLLNPNGGGIALITTVRLVYAGFNFELNQFFFKSVFEKVNGETPRLGDVFRLTKTARGASVVNDRNFTLLGDPALKLAYPQHRVQTSTVNNNPAGSITDTLKALSMISVSGYVQDESGAKLSNYNGVLYPTVYDKAVKVSTLGNDGSSSVMSFTLQKNILYRGKISVTNGDFSFSFMVPKDIAYQYGPGKISYYAENGVIDAHGAYEQFVIGGSATNTVQDDTGPEVKLYMNDDKFVLGGMTNENPQLYAIVRDSNGVNTVGNGIGHDITAILDENTEKAIVLNDYYQADLNSYKSGTIRYPFSGLSEGRHTLRIKVWDVFNNSAQTYTEFIVAKSAKLALSHVFNYPNPFTTKTAFYFEHNQVCNELNVQVQVFTVSGKLIKTLSTFVHTEGFRSAPIYWDGKDDFGNKIGKGVYLYRLKVRASDGAVVDKFERLVILN